MGVTVTAETSVVSFIGFRPTNTHPEGWIDYADRFLISNCLHIDFEYGHGQQETDQWYMIWIKFTKTDRKRESRACPIGHVSLPRENEAGGSWGQEIHIFHVNI